MFVAKPDELKGITVIDEYFLQAPRQRGGARGSGTRPNSVGGGGSGRGQATSSAAHTSAPTVAAPTRNESAGDLLTAIVDVAGSVVDSAAQVMTGAVSSGLSLLADAYASDEEGEKQTVIDVEAESKAAELQRKKELQTKWTGKVWNGEAHQFETKIPRRGMMLTRWHRKASMPKVSSRMRGRQIETKKRRMKWKRMSLQGRITGRMRIRTMVTSPPAAWCVCLPCSLARILIQILWGVTTKRTRMWVGRLPEVTRLRRAGPVNGFVDKDPLKQWVSAFVAVCRNGSPFAEKGRKIFFFGG